LSDAYAAVFQGSPIQPAVGNQITFDLKKLTVAGNTLKLVGKLPAGLKYNATTGLLSGTITAAPGTYPLSVQIYQGKTLLRTVSLPITVLAFPGSLIGNYEALLEDSGSVPVGVCQISITNADQWTASLLCKGASKRTAKGSFILDQGAPIAPITAVFPAASGAGAITVQISVNGGTPTFNGTFNGGSVLGFHLASGSALPSSTSNYSLVLDQGVRDGITVPAGLGWMKGSVNTLGVGTFTGMLGDGMDSSLSIHLTATGQAIVWAQPYANKNSYFAGLVTLGNLGLPAFTGTRPADRAWWSKAADAKSLSYPNGFPGMALTLGTSKWITPSTATALGASLGWRNNRTASVSIDGAGLSNRDPQTSSPPLPTEFSLDDQFNLATSAPVSPAPIAWSGKASSTNGAVSGTLTLPGGAAPVSAVLVQDDPWAAITGCGLIKVPVSGIKGSFKTAAFVFHQ